MVHDREVQLYDGKRLLSHDKYAELLDNGYTKEQLDTDGVFRIHPSFRIVALAEPPKGTPMERYDFILQYVILFLISVSVLCAVDSGSNWLTPELLSLFLFHDIRILNKTEEMQIMNELVGLLSSIFKIFSVGFIPDSLIIFLSQYGEVSTSMHRILNLAIALREAKDPILKSLSATLSTRQLLRIGHRGSVFASVGHIRIFIPQDLGITEKPSFVSGPYEFTLRNCTANILSEIPTGVATCCSWKRHEKAEY